MFTCVAVLKDKWEEIKIKRSKTKKIVDTEANNNNNAESMVLLASHEFPTLDAIRRKDIISCLLLGIQDSVCPFKYKLTVNQVNKRTII